MYNSIFLMRLNGLILLGIAAIILSGCDQSKPLAKQSGESTGSEERTETPIVSEIELTEGTEANAMDMEDFDILSYVKWPDKENGTYRTFKYQNEDQIAQLFLMQEVDSIGDTLTQMKYSWLRGDSIPMNMSVERYSKSNWLEFVRQAFYEPAPNGEIREISAHLDGKTKFAYNDPELQVTVFYAFYNDPMATMDFISKMRYSMEQVDEIDPVNPCLVLSSDELAKMYFKDDRENTEQPSFSRLTYKKGKGLVRIYQSNTEMEMEYNIEPSN